jgi:site-specific recombinase XerD
MSDPYSVGRQPAEWLAATRQALRLKRYTARTHKAYLGWLTRYLRFRARFRTTDDVEVLRQFLTRLASHRRVSPATQKQALSAIRFAFANGLGRPLPWLDGFQPAFRPPRLPMLMYGSGLRLSEALGLRIKDVDFERSTVMVRGGKGEKDRATVFPASLHPLLEAHITRVKRLHERDLARGAGAVALPGAFGRKSPSSAWSWE